MAAFIKTMLGASRNSRNKKGVWPVVLDLPYPPTTNHMYYHTRSGGRVLTKKARLFRSEVVKICDSIQARHLERFDRYRLHIQIFRPDRRRRDMSNIIKATEDALERGGLLDNDFDFWKSSQERMEEIVKGGKIRAFVWGYNACKNKK